MTPTCVASKIIVSHTIPESVCQEKNHFLKFLSVFNNTVTAASQQRSFEDGINSKQVGMAMLSVFISLVHPARTQELKETRFS